MKSVLQKIPLKLLIKQPVMFDANIFMVGIGNRSSDSNCSFGNKYTVYLKPLFESFQQIIIHEMVYNELDEDTKRLVDSYKGKRTLRLLMRVIYMEKIRNIQQFLTRLLIMKE